MTRRLQQTGIFKASPQSWDVNEAKSGAVAINIGFLITDELENDEWASWAEFDQHMVYGDWWVVKKDGKINQGAVDQLAECLGWTGDLNAVIGPPPAGVVQINVKSEVYNGETKYKAGWMNPEDYDGPQGGFGGADASATQALQNRFGSLLKAAAAVSTGKNREPSAAGPKAAGPKPSGPKTDEPSPQPVVVMAPCSNCGKQVDARTLDEKKRTCLDCDDIPF